MFDCPYCHAPFALYSSLLNHKRDDHPAPEMMRAMDSRGLDLLAEKVRRET